MQYVPSTVASSLNSMLFYIGGMSNASIAYGTVSWATIAASASVGTLTGGSVYAA
jgi:hypothetical protein